MGRFDSCVKDGHPCYIFHMTTKTCTKCQIPKILDDFYDDARQSSGKRPDCKECQKNQGRTKYATDETFRQNKQAQAKAYQHIRRREFQIRILTILKHTGCKDCSEKDPLVLDFDHMRDKKSGVSRLLRNNASWDDIEAEIAKCEVRCSNCHRKKTAKERGYYADIDLAAL